MKKLREIKARKTAIAGRCDNLKHFTNKKKGGNIMKTNIGDADRLIRFIVGVIIILAGVYFKTGWGAVGLLPIFTGFIRYCPLYVPLKINTQAKKS